MHGSRLNLFQRLLRQWDQIHPYNAAQLFRLSGAIEPAAADDAWCYTLAGSGLGPVQVNRRHFTFDPPQPDAIRGSVRIVEPGTPLEQFISEQMNRRFEPCSIPFRPFLLQRAGETCVGLIYHHWVADSIGIRLLMRRWLDRLLGIAADSGPLRLARGGYWRHFGPGSPRWPGFQAWLDAARWSGRLRRACRIECPSYENFEQRIHLVQLPDGWIDAVRLAARRRQCKVNDLFLAALARVCHQLAPIQRRANRQDLALGSIVDLRGPGGAPEDEFGLFLGFTNFICRPNELLDPGRLVGSIAAQARLQRQSGVAAMSMARVALGLLAGVRMSSKKLIHFYRKRMPVAGGISNVNLNGTWLADHAPHPLLDYIRISPTGPMLPFVLATTTLGNRFHVAATYRPALVSPDRAKSMVTLFIRELEQIAR